MSDYEQVNILDDNIDVKLVLSTGEVYSATLFTLSNIRQLMDNSDSLYFKAEDMIVFSDLSRLTIRKSISQIIEQDSIDFYFSEIGALNNGIFSGILYENLRDFGSPIIGFSI